MQAETATPPSNLTIADLADKDGNLLGYAMVFQDDDGNTGVGVVARGLTPGSHGIHIHAVGNCDPAGETPFAQAGSHFDPANGTHPNHAGDLGNLVADADGDVLFSAFGAGLRLGEDASSLQDADGSALVIHADADDLATDPSGNSGPRIACAVLFPPRG